MSTIRDQIVAAMVSTFNTSRPATVPAAERSPYQGIQLDDDTPKSASFYWLEDDEINDGADEGPLSMHQMTVALEARAVAGDTTTPEVELDPIAAWAVKSLVDNRLSDLALYLRVMKSVMSRAIEQTDRPVGKLVILYLVKFTSRAKDAEVRA